MHKKTIAALAMAISFSAQAEWAKVTESAHRTFYIDYTTIKKTQHGYRAWERQDYQTRDELGHLSNELLVEYDCKDERSRTLQGTYFYGHMSEGGVSDSDNTPTEWNYARPGSIAETMLEEVCRAGK